MRKTFKKDLFYNCLIRLHSIIINIKSFNVDFHYDNNTIIIDYVATHAFM